MVKQKYQEIPLSQIVLSGDNQRKIDETSQSFLDLVESVRAAGVQVPVHVRPHPEKKGKYELRAGERRFRAAKAAGLKTVFAIVRFGTDNAAAMRLTYIENKFREDLKPLEEAQEVALLVERFGGDAKAVADAIGKKPRWVRERAHVMAALSKPWQKLFQQPEKDGRFANWTLAHLVVLSRLPEHLQARVHKELTHSWSHAERLTAADLADGIAKEMHTLKKAKWDLDDQTLCPTAGACSACTKRTGHQPMLWYDTEDQAEAGDECLDSGCWQTKEIAWLTRQASDLKAKHPKLVLIAKDYPEHNEAQRIQQNIGPYLPNWEYKSASKASKGAVPAMHVMGKAAGHLTYVRVIEKTTATSRTRAAGVPTPLKQRKAQLDAKRWAQVLLDLREKVAASTVADITYKEKVTALMGLVACYGNRKLYHIPDVNRETVEKWTRSKKGQAEALELLWASFIPTMNNLLTWNGPVTHTPKGLRDEAGWIAGLIGADLKAMFDDVCTRKGFTPPKSWKNLNEDGTPKADKPVKKKAESKAVKKAKKAPEKAIADGGSVCDEIDEESCRACEDAMCATSKSNESEPTQSDAA